jgi:hypothetical protein
VDPEGKTGQDPVPETSASSTPLATVPKGSGLLTDDSED